MPLPPAATLEAGSSDVLVEIRANLDPQARCRTESLHLAAAEFNIRDPPTTRAASSKICPLHACRGHGWREKWRFHLRSNQRPITLVNRHLRASSCSLVPVDAHLIGPVASGCVASAC
jgi:hypothetical protein